VSTRINTNINAIVANRQLGKKNAKLKDHTAKLASGSRIVKAGDDAAGLAISSKLKAHMVGKKMALRNTNDAISIVQNATSPLQSLQNMVTRMRELAIQSASDTYSNQERELLHMEIVQSKDEIQRLARSTESFGHKFLNGTQKKLDVQVDSNHSSNDRISISTADLAQTVHALGIFDVAVNTQLQARESLQKLDYALDTVSESRAKLGAYAKRLEAAANTTETSHVNISAGHSQIKDLDYANETAEKTKSEVTREAATSVSAQANVSAQTALRLIG